LKNAKLYWRINEAIRVPEVRVIGEDGKQLGVLAISEAISKARNAGLTLVEIAPNAKPPVCKVVDFGKFRYQEEKKLRKVAKGAKGGEIKEVRFSPFIAENDFNTRLEKVKEFLAEKNKVRLVVVFTGPQMRVKHTGFAILKKISENLGEAAIVDMQPKFLGKHLNMVISPTNKKVVQVK
jgi:translation initiation factor IF-3